MIIPPGAPTVLIGGLPAATATSMTEPCMLPGCVPGGPGYGDDGIGNGLDRRFAGGPRGDQTTHPSCVAPIPSPMGQILPPGCPTVMIGG